ncbi:MAG: DUF362 domain-containing protein [Deltaproteobacteria bacterium]|nr:DUF362 domain-containing protein [Deltaproteobacteria bacterium]
MDRREFLKLQAKLGLMAAAAASGVGLFSPDDVSSAAVPDIAVAQGPPGAAVRAAIKVLGGMGRFIKNGDRVVIKPNMSFAEPPESATTTHPEVVAALAALCLEAGAFSVLVVDNPLFNPLGCLDTTRIREACSSLPRVNVRVLYQEPFFSEKRIQSGRVLNSTLLMKDVLLADKIIAAPVAKSHTGAGVSLSMKGMMGLVLDRKAFHRNGLHESIVDLHTVLKADLTVVDATRVLSSNGPGGPGKILRPGKVIASADMVAADAYTTASFDWYGKKYAPRQVRHLRLAHERGLGRMDIENLMIKEIRI